MKMPSATVEIEFRDTKPMTAGELFRRIVSFVFIAAFCIAVALEKSIVAASVGILEDPTRAPVVVVTIILLLAVINYEVDKLCASRPTARQVGDTDEQDEIQA